MVSVGVSALGTTSIHFRRATCRELTVGVTNKTVRARPSRLARLHSSHTLAHKQPGLQSSGVQSVVSNAEGLQRADQGRR